MIKISEPPDTRKPQHLNNAEARCLLELPSVEGVETFNSQISIG